ncbi:MAG: hypothetical protein Q4P78_03550 [Rothia sp. (in: high G+C Gram-positive bacteria)]|uniref:hypothetical protein n=1 Tax=Rothia sp. (in: high G+C Gram-positive bacteria) TaxID=1885016 RepID=UPI0026DFA515|nr:hypothetical protein [Rothia sp. (in: high G+C Gram-positive bacteria)]MDO5750264.1 hypothetical protein [Rothia sp. (in: high G+C Gram-positive bacteria)]
MKFNRRLFLSSGIAAAGIATLQPSAIATPACITVNGRSVPLNGAVTTAQHCYWNADPQAKSITLLAPINRSLTPAHLEAIENISPLNGRLINGTFATQRITGHEPVQPNSAALSKELTAKAHPVWHTSFNAGQVGNVRVGAHDNIPALSVDSSNPHQHYVEIVSRDNLVNANDINRRMVTGAVPVPKWFLDMPRRGKDYSIAVYDKATGIWRSLFMFLQDSAATTYTSVARIRVGNASAQAPAISKIFYSQVPQVQVGQSTSLSPISVDMNASNKHDANAQYPISRGAKFRLIDNAGGAATIDASTGQITFKASTAHANKLVELKVAVDYPAVYRVSSAGYMIANRDFNGVGAANYWLTLKNGTSSVVGMANELTQIGVDEIRAGRINHVVSITAADYTNLASFPAKGSDGHHVVANAPRAGQRGFLPASFNVDAYLKSTNQANDQLKRMILVAMKEYGFMICDRNAFNNAFNLESPLSYASYARRGLNVYEADPAVKKVMDSAIRFTGSAFPWDQVKWLPVHFAQH